MTLIVQTRGIACFALSICLLLVGCDDGEARSGEGPGGDRYSVVATVGMVGDVVRNVAGNRAEVSVLMGEGVDPHLYKATRDDVARLSRADVVFSSGLLLEGTMGDVLDKLGSNRPVVAVAERVDESALLASQDYAGHPDPHLWMDPAAWAQTADVVADTLAEYDAANADLYRANAAAYKDEVLKLDAYGKEVLATIPENRRVLVTSHDAFNYFGRAFGLDVQGVQGISTESEAGLQRVNALVDMLVERGIGAVFVETSVPQKSIEALVSGAESRGHAVGVGGTLYSDAMGSAGTYEGTYIGMIDHNITTVARALGGEAPSRGLNGKLGDE